MEKTTVKSIKAVCYIALMCIAIWVAFYAIQSYFVLTTGSGQGVINWGSPNMGLKLTLFWSNRLTILLMAGLFTAFVLNILKSVRTGVIFNRTNVKILWAIVIVIPIHALISDNMGFAVSAATECHDLVLTDSPFVYTIVALLVAMLYKVACDAAEEQNLTI